MGAQCCRRSQNQITSESQESKSEVPAEDDCTPVESLSPAFKYIPPSQLHTVRSCTSSKLADFTPYDPEQSELIFPPALVRYTPQPLRFQGQSVVWYRPTSLPQLLEIKNTYPQAKIVVGNTEVGIETKFKNLTYPVLVGGNMVPELNELQTTEQGVTAGASVTVNGLMSYLAEMIKTHGEAKCQNFIAINNQLRWFASNQVRNAAAIGGNIVTASPISDLNPALQAAEAVLTVASVEGERTVAMRDWFLGYRVVDLKQNEVLKSVFIPFSQPSLEHAFSYKQARRREDDIAIVTCGFRVLLKPVQDAKEAEDRQFEVVNISMSFGGMAPITVMARRTMDWWGGKVWNRDNFQQSLAVLAQDLNLSDTAPGGMIEYRRSLCSSFFFKFFSLVCVKLARDGYLSSDSISADLVSAQSTFHRPTSFGVQEYQVTRDHNQVVGKSTVHASAYLQTTGEAKYVDDIPNPSDGLYSALVLSTKPHARLLSLDASAALAVPGVVGFFSAKDVPHNLIGEYIMDEEVFASERVVCVGQMLGLVVAESEAVAQAAAKLVRVEYEDLPAVLSIDDALETKSFFPILHRITDGNVEQGFAESDVILEGEVRVGGQDHFYLETQACLAVPGECDEMVVFSSTQNPTKTQETVAHVLGLPQHRVMTRVKRLGGGFGGKETRSIFFAVAVSVAARALNRPVRISLDRDVDMVASGQRHPYLGRYKVGVSSSGQLKAMYLEVFGNAGCTYDLSVPVLDRCIFHVDNVYKIPHVDVIGRLCRTNLPSNTAFRGFGGPQGLLMMECIMDHVTHRLNLSRDVVRVNNFYPRIGGVTHFKQVLDPFYVPQMWDELIQTCEYERRLEEVKAFNQQNRYHKRGIAMLPTKFGCSFTSKFLNQGGALVHVYTDGTVLVSHGGTEMGQGLHTKMAQVAATMFQIPLKDVFIAETATDKVINTSATAGSMSSDINGAAIVHACQQILDRLKPYLEQNPDKSFRDIVNMAYMDRVNLSAQGFYSAPFVEGAIWDPVTGQASGVPFLYFSHGVACSEVEVDTLTGDHQILRTDILMDVGVSLNPSIDIGQIEGAFLQGVGWCTLEELVRGDKDHAWVRPGHLFTRGPGVYNIPAFNDVPIDFRVHFLKNAPNPRAIYSSKAIGEPPLFLSASVFFAIKEAIYAARQEHGLTDWFPLHSPATSERIRMACTDDFVRQFVPQPETYMTKGSF
eukprot:TRINITY_DN701_c0_g2_i7.p1 TRINITY_DN701_c0_g2~~TRINITY_DN701_c0_g2_i7.p1  ORF type:complete len:1205 (-),score=381.89 TRINITY_DN701_c0_g2_i7:387-4001(-)